MAKHEHAWVELRRQIPWTVDDFDKDRLAPERSRYEDGTPHTDDDHYAKVPSPRPEVVFKCYGCDTVETVPLPVEAYKRIVTQLANKELQTNHPSEGNHLSSMPLEQLVPELAGELEKRGLVGLTGTHKFAASSDGLVVSDADYDAAQDTDARLRKQLGLPPRDEADAAERAGRDKWFAEAKKAETVPPDQGNVPPADEPELAPEARQIVDGKDNA